MPNDKPSSCGKGLSMYKSEGSRRINLFFPFENEMDDIHQKDINQLYKNNEEFIIMQHSLDIKVFILKRFEIRLL